MIEPWYPSLNILGFRWQGSEFHSSGNVETSAPSCPSSASPIRMLSKSSASSLIVLNFINDLFWEQLSHETPARQSSLFAHNSKPNHILNTLDLFLSLSTHLCPGLSHLRSLCRFFCTHTYSLYSLINMLVCDWNICSNQLKFCRSKQMIQEVWGGEGTEMKMTYFSFWTKVSLKNTQNVTLINWSLICSIEQQSSHPTP